MINVGSKVRISGDLTEKQTGIAEESLFELRGKETVVIEVEPDRSNFTLEIDESWCWDEAWLEEIVEETTETVVEEGDQNETIED